MTNDAPATTGRPRVAVIGMGGTIASLGRDRLDLANYGDARNVMHADEVTRAVPELGTVAEIVPIRFRNMPAIEIGPADWLDLNREIHAAAAADPPPAGIVVTHGTATLEETAYFLNLVVKVGCPVVVTGSQRPFSAVSSEAPLNLISAVRVAASPHARGQGVLVVLNEEVNAAREVTKTDTYRVQAFQAPGLGALGYVDSDRVSLYRAPLRRHTTQTPFDVRDANALPRVDMVVSYAGSDGMLIDAARAAGARGIVAAGFAPGFGSPGEVAALERAVAAGVVVVQAARAHSGRVDARDRIRAAGFVAADNLSPQKARVLLMVALTQTRDCDAIQRMFWEY